MTDSSDSAGDATQSATDEVTFGSYLRALRRRAKISAPTLAKRLGVSLPYYVRIELNGRAPLGADRWGPLVELGAEPETLDALTAAYWKARAGRSTGRPTGQARHSVPPGHPRSCTWEELDWEDDDRCWYVVAHHPEGLTVDQISALTGWSPNRIDQIERSALAKLAHHKEAREALGCLQLLRQHRDRMWHAALGAQ